MKQTAYLRHIAYDSVIFGFSGEKLKILITKYHNTGLFALPGGFVKMDENLNDAVRRGLKERTGLDNIYLEQFYTFGDVARFRPEVMQTILEANGHSIQTTEWMLDRFISVAYYAPVSYTHLDVYKRQGLSLHKGLSWNFGRVPADQEGHLRLFFGRENLR